MKKYDFNNPQVFEQLEDKAIDGQLDYSAFPPPEYKYFSRLARVGYNNRHKGWDINICLEWQDKLRTEYKRDRNNADEYRMLSQRFMDNVKKSADFVRKMYQSQTNEQTVINALQALECLTNENGLTKRITEKLKENDKMKLRQEIDNTRETIDGELNRIMVTDDIEEIRGLTYYLFCNINDLICKNQQRIAKSLRGEEND